MMLLHGYSTSEIYKVPCADVSRYATHVIQVLMCQEQFAPGHTALRTPSTVKD